MSPEHSRVRSATVAEISAADAGEVPGLEAVVSHWTEGAFSASEWYAEVSQAWGTAGFAVRLEKRVETLGWTPSCDCPAADPVPCVVLDPFLGSGTTLMVADWTGRDGVGIELSAAYAEMARKRICAKGELFTEVSIA